MLNALACCGSVLHTGPTDAAEGFIEKREQ